MGKRQPLVGEDSLADPSIERFLSAMSSAPGLTHTRGSFRQHLTATWWILAMWGMPRFLCRAGLAHSCYSTMFYPDALTDIRDRKKVQTLIGTRAERLVFLFCVLDRTEMWKLGSSPNRYPAGVRIRHACGTESTILSRDVLKDLLIIEAANLAEQSAESEGSPVPWMWRLSAWSSFIGNVGGMRRDDDARDFTFRRDQEAVSLYKAITCDQVKVTHAHLKLLLTLNPFAGEVWLLAALEALDRNESQAAFMMATKGYELLLRWAVSWDKRLSLESWLHLCRSTSMQAMSTPAEHGAAFTLRDIIDLLGKKTFSKAP